MSEKTKRVFEFGPFRLDPRERVLLRGGVSVPLTPRAFELLVNLVEHHGRLLAKDDLMKLVWPESFVEDTNLTHHISVLRNTLGEDSGPFIETVSRRGYRFVAPVKERLEDHTRTGVGSTQTESVPDRRDAADKRRVLWIAAPVIALCGLAAVMWRPAGVGDGGSTALRAAPLTTLPGMELYPTFSPDRSQVAFSWLKPGELTTDIYIQQVAGATPLRLTTDPAHDWNPSWSPDGRWIAFIRWSDSGANALMVMPPLPGAPQKLADISVRFARGRMFSGSSIAWSPDSKWIAVTDNPAPDNPFGLCLFLVSLETGERRRLTSPPRRSVIDGNPAFSSDSRSVAFTRGEVHGSREIFVVRLSRDMRPLEPAYRVTSMRRFVGSPVWANDGRDIFFLSGENLKGGQLWRVRVPNAGEPVGQPELVPAPVESSYSMTIRFDRGGLARMAYMRHIFDPNIWALDLKDRIKPAQAPRMLGSSTLEDYNAQFSPDGSSIVFSSFRSGTPEIWKSDRDGLNPIPLTSLKGPYAGWPRWSPDGQWITLHWGPEDNFDIYVIKADGGVPKRITRASASDSHASWSRDGRWIYFASDRSGERQVWKVKFEPDSPVDSGEPIQVTKGGGYISLESLDGRTLYYSKGFSLWSVQLGGGEERQVGAELVRQLGLQVFAPTSDGIYFLARSEVGTPGRIQFLNSATGKISTVLNLEKPGFLGLSLSPDGRRLLFSQVDSEESDLMMVDNWKP